MIDFFVRILFCKMLRLGVVLCCLVIASHACSDTDEDCPRFKHLCGVNSYIDKHCIKTCDQCNGGGGGNGGGGNNGGGENNGTHGTTTPTTKVPCHDKDWQCPTLTHFCGKNTYVDKYCLKSCPKACKKLNSAGGDGENEGNNNATCGISKVVQSRVVNGIESQPGAWPWIISLQSVRGSHFCGGTILTPTWVLTASHCVKKYKDKPAFMIVAGAHDKEWNEESQQRIGAKKIIMHPNYGRYDILSADVALIQLERPLKLNDRVVKACMPQQGIYPRVGKNCYIAGWGATYHPGGAVDKLRQARLPVVSTPHIGCHNNTEVVCVGLGFGKQPDGKQHPNACRGDSGGPLMCQQSNGSWSVEGVASYVYTYCKYYTAYAPVNKYLPWIKKYVKGL